MVSEDITEPEQGSPEEQPGDTGTGTGTGEGAVAGGPGRRGSPTWVKVVGVALVVAAVGGGAYWLGRSDTGVDSTTVPATTDEPTDEPSGDAPEAADAFDPEDVVEFHDPETGIRLSHPASWTPLEPNDDDQGLRLLLSAGGLDSVLVRVIPLEGAVETDQELADMNAVTDGIISSAVSVLEERPIELNGLAGYYYLYLFDDPASGEEGVHAHYFLFEGKNMYVVVFQAVPTANFDVLAPAFDVIADSFRVETEGDG